MSFGIVKSASLIPSVVNSNEDVCSNVPGLTPEWILQKTGIKRRFHVKETDTASLMASAVALKLSKDLENEIGLIIVTSFSQDYMFPPLSVAVHKAINAPRNCQIMDINVNCVGLITGTTIAVERMRSDSKIKFALVIGVEILSRFVDKTDKFTAPFFSDGASGVLLGRVAEGYGLIGAKFCTDSSVYEEVRCERGGFIKQNGRTTWAQAITYVPYVMKELCKEQHVTLESIDFIVFHQANKVLIDYILDKNQIPHDKTFTNVEEIGNTGAASIGIALDQALRKRLIKKGDLVMLAGVGAGFNYGANLWKMW